MTNKPQVNGNVAKRHKGVSYAKYGYIFSIPFVLTFLLFTLYPIVYTLLIGFTDLQGVAATDINFLTSNPFDNFKSILTNDTFKTSFKNTIILWTANFIPQITIALMLTAWFTNQRRKLRGQGAFKVLFYMPNIMTAATIALLFSALFSYPKGVINDLFLALNLSDTPIEFFRDKTTARGVVAFIQFWMWYGNTMIVLIAGALGINPSLYESAEIDGASAVQSFFRITIPCLRTIILYVLVTSMIGGLQMFDIPYLLVTNSGPDNATMTTSVFIYRQAFRGRYLYNRAAAASVIMALIAAVLSGVLFFILRDKDAARLKKEERMRRKQQRLEQKNLAPKGGQ